MKNTEMTGPGDKLKTGEKRSKNVLMRDLALTGKET